MEETDSYCSAGNRGHASFCFNWRPNRAASVELAGARALRMAPDRLLAGPRTSGTLPHPLWRVWISQLRRLQDAAPDEGALRKHVARRAAAFSRAPGPSFRRQPSCRREQGIACAIDNSARAKTLGGVSLKGTHRLHALTPGSKLNCCIGLRRMKQV